MLLDMQKTPVVNAKGQAVKVLLDADENVVVDLGGTIIIDHFHFPTAFEALLKTSG